MKNRVEEILKDLYAVDPGLSLHEAELTRLISTLLSSAPDTKFDESFAARLRKELLTRHGSLHAASPFVSFFSMWRAQAIAFALVLLLLTPLAFKLLQGPARVPSPQNLNGKIAKLDITNVGNAAFGTLGSSLENAHQDTNSSVAMGSPQATAPKAAMMLGAGGGISGSAGSGVAMPEYIGSSFHYVYKGSPISVKDIAGPVLMRKKGIENTADLKNFVTSSNLDLLNISNFQNLKIRSLDVVEDRELGYSLNYNFDEGNISINQNWERWPMMKEPIPPSSQAQRVSDAEAIKIAQAFLASYNIHTGLYGEPEVVSQQYQIMATAPESSTKPSLDSTQTSLYPYYSDIVTVVWPLVIDNKKVYDEGGSPFGLSVSVNSRAKKVVSVYNLTSTKYNSSTYNLETDIKRIQKIAEQGGLYGYSDSAGSLEVSLGTPVQVWMRYFQYKDGTNSELFVPALLFPIDKVPKNVQVYQKAILVPLVREILDTASNQPPLIMPMKEGVINPSVQASPPIRSNQ